MNVRLARLLMRFYPRRWRERYGAEFEALLQCGPASLRTIADIMLSGFCEHIVPTLGADMSHQTYPFGLIIRQPTAFVPIAMSLAALTLVLVTITVFGVAHQPSDEGTSAHIWQLLMAGQLPLLALFAIRWLPRAPKQTLYVLALQAGAVLASMAPVLFLGL
ncbi:hypothetical protein [Edaphobacter modestus]|uniref:Uncharacterized protein n=1 Tax=Edaphobacter modestus TaxID=388466 RepID=A0A4Q7YUD8_9BACT|nr:hypothetical protein [Edaphobacter modestus]RZU41387.1 hypothetical protein BDD14_2909 [Edaphobacter modestus]